MEFPGFGNVNKTSPHEIAFIEEIKPKLTCLEENNVGECSKEERDSGSVQNGILRSLRKQKG